MRIDPEFIRSTLGMIMGDFTQQSDALHSACGMACGRCTTINSEVYPISGGLEVSWVAINAVVRTTQTIQCNDENDSFSQNKIPPGGNLPGKIRRWRQTITKNSRQLGMINYISSSVNNHLTYYCFYIYISPISLVLFYYLYQDSLDLCFTIMSSIPSCQIVSIRVINDPCS